MAKLWDKGFEIASQVEKYTVGKDRELDIYLAKHDIAGSMAHITMLQKIGLLELEELEKLKESLIGIYQDALKGNFVIEEGIEDVHSQVEQMLTSDLGDIGKKIHSGRSRNDQVLLDLKLFMREEMTNLVNQVTKLFNTFLKKSEENKTVLMPGYTHLQVAMPSSFGLWFGAFAESLTDDLELMLAAYNIVNQNPLGSAAGYGSSFPLDRTYTTQLLGFNDLNYNVIYAQMGRGKAERSVATAIAALASTIGKFANDACMFMSQNFSFISLPNELTTGSSIMPHKKNPDIFEITRGKCNKLQSLPFEINGIINNLTTGYFRDLQVIKETIVPAFEEINSILEMMVYTIDKIAVNKAILDDKKYDYLFSVELVNKLVLEGVPFREAYRKVGIDIEKGNFKPDKTVHHTHEGSIGNLCNNKISAKLNKTIEKFNFDKYQKAIKELMTL